MQSLPWPEEQLFVRLEGDGQPGLVRGLRMIAAGEATKLIVNDAPGVSDDPEVTAAIKAFLRAHGGELVTTPLTKG